MSNFYLHFRFFFSQKFLQIAKINPRKSFQIFRFKVLVYLSGRQQIIILTMWINT